MAGRNVARSRVADSHLAGGRTHHHVCSGLLRPRRDESLTGSRLGARGRRHDRQWAQSGGAPIPARQGCPRDGFHVPSVRADRRCYGRCMRPRPRVGVFPAAAYHGRRELFATLALAFPVGFEGRQPGSRQELDAAIVFGDDLDAQDIPVPCLMLTERGEGQPRSGTIELTTHELVDSRLRGRRLAEHDLQGETGVEAHEGDTELATFEGRPVWVRRAQQPARWAGALAPRELAPGHVLREQLSQGYFLSLLPLVDFLRTVVGYHAGERASLR